MGATVRTLFPGALNPGRLLGGYHAVGLEWADGALPVGPGGCCLPYHPTHFDASF